MVGSRQESDRHPAPSGGCWCSARLVAWSQLAVQIASWRVRSWSACCSSENIELVKGLGADVVVDYTQGDALAPKPGAWPSR